MIFRLIRTHQWSKNALLVLPALAAHQAFSRDLVVTVLLAVTAFSFLASAFYIVNDVVDLASDRGHPTKRHRPIAAGDVGVGVAIALAVVLVSVAAWISLTLLPGAFAVAAGVYALLTVAYSLGLKRVVLLDVLVLASLYALRVIAGAAAVEVPLSRWFLAFSVFVFLSLALVKRAVELRDLRASGTEPSELEVRGRGWRIADLPVLVGLGVSSAVAGALVYCLYITSEDVLRLYASPDYLWGGLPVLLYWFGRVWIGVARDEVPDDPVLFALRDPASYLAGAIFLAVVLVAR